jgi:NAD+ kinase
MRFGIIANMERPDAVEVVGRIMAWAEKYGVTLRLGTEEAEKMGREYPTFPRSELPAQSDVIISLGGDGTLLASARVVRDHGTPILGINLGSLGFLTQLTPVNLEETLTAVLEKRHRIEKRMVAEAEIEHGPEIDHPFALNDVVVDRGSVSRIISLDLYANDYFICSYAADGLIICTPTGSTAYSLAVGGPILTPMMNAFTVSPISAFSLTTRPIIFSGNDDLRVVVRSKHSNPVLTLDGQVDCRLPQESSFIVRKADYYINFIVFRSNTFYDVLRSKLHWGRLPEGDPGRRPKYY